MLEYEENLFPRISMWWHQLDPLTFWTGLKWSSCRPGHRYPSQYHSQSVHLSIINPCPAPHLSKQSPQEQGLHCPPNYPWISNGHTRKCSWVPVSPPNSHPTKDPQILVSSTLGLQELHTPVTIPHPMGFPLLLDQLLTCTPVMPSWLTYGFTR